MASLGQLTAGIAHEINNPVNFIMGGIVSLQTNLNEMQEVLDKYSEVNYENLDAKLEEIKSLKEELEFEEVISEIDMLCDSINNGAIQTAEIVKGLRTFSRLDEDSLKTINVHENIDSTLVLLHNKYKGRISIVKKYGNIPNIECFPGKLNQVYMNIINNAIQAIDGEGEIRIETTIANGSTDNIMVKISDTGTGMSEEVVKKIFDPFFTTKDIGEGTGLGLSISHGIIENHNGKINVYSKPGNGTTFEIVLPVKSAVRIEKSSGVEV
jgi:signal transduction histidine kinase